MLQRCSRIRLALALGASLLFLSAAIPAAAQPFPSRPIRLVLPYDPGSEAESVYRPIAEHMTRGLAQPVVIEHRPGGGGMVANIYVKNAAPDGYTIFATSNSATVRSLGDQPKINVLRDYSAIALSNISALVIAVNADQIKARNLRELIEETRAHPGKLSYASYGVGSGGHMFFELLANDAKIKCPLAHFQSGTEAAAETAAGRTQIVGSIMGTIAPHATSGKLRVLAVSTQDRFALAPDLPGMRESGFAQLDYPLWAGYVGPAGLPREIVNRLNHAINAAMKDPGVVELYRTLGVLGIGGRPEKLVRMIEREYGLYTKLVSETGLKLE